MEPIINKIKDGIHMDNAVLEQPEDTYRYARNFVIHQVASGMYKAATLKGTELYFTMTANEKPMAFTSIRNRYFMIVLNTVDNLVKFYEIFDNISVDPKGTCDLKLLKQISNTYLNLSFDWPIRTIFGFYENDKVQRIYWTDYNNSPRVVNVEDMAVDNAKFAKYLSFTPILENIYGQFVFNAINAGGNLLNGNYFIAWQYYTKDGYYSDWSPLSTPISITPSTVGATFDSYQDYEGAAPALNSSKSIQFKIRNIDTDYDSMRIAAFYSNDYNSAGPGIIFYDGDINSAEMTFYLRGSENLGTLTLDELIEHTMVVEKCKNLGPIKLYNVAACLKERDELDFSVFHDNNKLPVIVNVLYNELLADTTGYPTSPFATGPKILFGVPKCAPIVGTGTGFAGIWYKATEVSTITTFASLTKTIQQGEYYKDVAGKFTLDSGRVIPVHKINKYDSEGVALKGTIVTVQTAQAATARKDTMIVDGTWGDGTVTINGLTKPIIFSNDVHDTVINFVTTWGADYLAAGVILSSHGGMATAHVLEGTAVTPGTDFNGPTVLIPTSGNFRGDVVNTTPFLPKVKQVSSLLMSGTEGFANFTFNGTSYVFPYMNSTFESNSWFQTHMNLFPEVTITFDITNHVIFTANEAGTPFTISIEHLAATGDLNGQASVVTPFSEGTNEQRTLNFAGSTSGAIDIIFGSTAYMGTLYFVGNIRDSIVTFCNTYGPYLHSNNIDVSYSYPGTTVMYVRAYVAGTPLPAITSQLKYGSMIFTNTLTQANTGPSIRQDKVILTGSGGGISITCANYTYSTWWQGTILATMQKYIADYGGFLDISYVTCTINGTNDALLFTSKFPDRDFPGVTSAIHSINGSLGGTINEVIPNFIGNKRKVTVTLLGTDGASVLSVNSLIKKITYLTSRADTALAFKNVSEAEFLTKHITLTNSGDDLILESDTNGLDFTTEVTMIHTNDFLISAQVVTSTPNTVSRIQIDKITLSGVKGIADIKVSGLIRTVTFGSSLAATTAQFVTDFAAGYDSYKNITVTSSGPDIIFTGKTSGTPFTGSSSIISKSMVGNIEELSYEGEYMDYKGPTAASKLRGYPSDEFVRLGVLFFDLKGKPFFVRWLDNTPNSTTHGDVYIPIRQNTVGSSNSFLKNYDMTVDDALGKEYGQVNSRNAYLNISGLDITPVKDLISGFMIVRAPIVHRNLTYGNLSFISADIVAQVQTDDYYLNPGYFRYPTNDGDKVPGVYAFVSPEDLFDFKNFVITKGDKLKNVLYLSPERKAFTIGNEGFTGLGKRDTSFFTDQTNYRENLYSKFYLPLEDNEAAANGKAEVMHEILYSLKYNVGDGAIGDPAGVVIDPRNVNKLFKDRTRDLTVSGDPWGSAPGKMNIVVLDIDEVGNNVKGHFDLGNTDPRMLICSIYRDNNDPYGGYGDASLANTLYMSTGHYQEINSAVLADIVKDGKYIFNNIEIYGGDTFVSLFDHKRNLLNEDAAGAFKYGYSTIFPVETRINIGLRQGNHVAKNHSYSTADIEGIRRKVGAMKLEDYNYNDGYSSDNINALYHALPFGFINNSKFEARMRYSQPKVPGEKVDKFRIFPPNNKIDLSINFGIINNIRENYGHLLYWQEDQIGAIPINERQLASNAFGNAVQLGVGGVFERYDEIVTKLGNSHQFGLIDSPIGYHWYDAKRRMYLSVYKDMKLSQDSIISGLNTFFDGLPDMIFHSASNIVDKSQDSLIYDRPSKDYGICGGFDPKNKVVFTTFFKPDGNVETVGISTLNNKFIGFFDYQSRFYFEMKNGLYSFKNNYVELHRHNTGNFLTFHGERKDGLIQIVVKDNSNLDKIYDTFDFIGNENFFNKIRYQNSDQNIEEVVDPNSLEEYRYRNKRWYGTVPLVERARVMDNYLLVTFKVDIAEEVELYQVTFNTRKMI